MFKMEFNELLGILARLEGMKMSSVNMRRVMVAGRMDSPQASRGAITNRRFIVGSLYDNGALSLATTPVTHFSESDAQAEATRLGKMNPGRTYVWLQLKGGVVTPTVVSPTYL